MPAIFYNRNNISNLPAGDLETELPNAIKIYGNKKAVDAITYLVDEYLSIWQSFDFVQIPLERWMKVHLKSGWETKVLTIKPSVYSLDIEAKRLVNKTFDKMTYLGRPKYTILYTPFSFSIFVVYKTNAK